MSVLDPVIELMRGLGTTLKMMFERPVTYQYPEQKGGASSFSWPACVEAL